MQHHPPHTPTVHPKTTQNCVPMKQHTLWEFIQCQIPAPLAPFIPSNPTPDSQPDSLSVPNSPSNTPPSTFVLHLDATSQQYYFQQPPLTENGHHLHQILLYMLLATTICGETFGPFHPRWWHFISSPKTQVHSIYITWICWQSPPSFFILVPVYLWYKKLWDPATNYQTYMQCKHIAPQIKLATSCSQEPVPD